MIPSIPPGTVIDQQRKRKIIDTGSGTLTVATNKRQRRQTRPQRENITDNDGGNLRDFVANIVFKPKTCQTMFTVSVNQAQVFCGSFSVSSIPKLFFNNILPHDSLVFQLAAKGRVEDLKSLIAEGKASLRDHDPDGHSLLHVSTVLAGAFGAR